MIKVSVFYPHKEDFKFDMDYYLNSHIPMVREKLGSAVKGVSMEQGIGGPEPGSPPIYHVMFHLFFDSLEAFAGAFGPHAESIRGDIPNYTDIEPAIQFSEVKI
jgi:uncharacterized protein (TIGR02118 family)